MKSRTCISLFLVIVLFSSGCATYLPINSTPSGAKVLFNGEPTQYVTPTLIAVRDVPAGSYNVSVSKKGYKTVTPPKNLLIKVHTSSVIMSVIFFWTFVPWIKQLSSNMWKAVYVPRSRDLGTFELVSENSDGQK